MKGINQHDKQLFHGFDVCIIIPCYNNSSTIAQVVDHVLDFTPNIIVVNDGSTDDTLNQLERFKSIEIISYLKNEGKGFAIRQGFKRALEKGFSHAITIDADGQHDPSDLASFDQAIIADQAAIVIGSRNIRNEGMPAKNTFANKFSNFWFWVETGQKMPDTQSGFRLYPIFKYEDTKFFTRKYEFEVEILVRSAWRGIPIKNVAISVDYPEDRVTHFRPFTDFFRISVLNTILVLIAWLYIYPRNFIRYLTRNRLIDIIKEQLAAHNESPVKVSFAIGFGIFMGIAPIWGFQMLAAAFLAHLFRLNKILVLVASNISIPPMIPLLIYLSYQTGRILLGSGNEITLETVIFLKDQLMQGNFYAAFRELGYSILDYVVGAFAFGLAAGVTAGLITFLIIKLSRMMK